MLKNDILNLLSIRDITNKYRIKVIKDMCKCPFGHSDSSPSMKIYDRTNSFYCFSCHATGDVIKFVQLMYGLNFQEAMEKINDDFQLGLSTKSSYNKQQIIQLEREKKLKEMQEQKRKKKENFDFQELCNRRQLYKRLINKFNKQINSENWEDLTIAISHLQERIGVIDMYIYDKFQII